MSKNRSLKIAIILIVLAFVAVGVGRYTGVLQSVISPGDGYFIYGQSDISITNLSCVTGASGGSDYPGKEDCTSAFYTMHGDFKQLTQGISEGYPTGMYFSGSDVNLYMGVAPYNRITVVTTRDFSGYDVRMDIAAHSSGSSGSGNINIGTLDQPTLVGLGFVSGFGSYDDVGTLELKRQVFSNTTQVYWKGQLVKTYATPTTPEKLRFFEDGGYLGGLSFHVTNLRYLPTFSCQLSSTDLLGMETFSGGVTSAITLQPSACNNSTDVRCLRYPVKSFCIDNRAILTDSTKGGAAYSPEPYQILIGGGQVPLTGTQTLTMFYVIDNSGGIIPTQCSISKAYNINNGTCDDLTGVVSICSQGILDSATGLCVVQPSVSCSAGTYNNSTGQCVYTPPTGISCPTDYVYDNASGNCLKTATPVTACTSGRLDLTTNTCIYNPPVGIVCNQGTYNNLTGQCELHIDTSCPTGFTYDPVAQSCKAPTVYATQQAAQNQTTTQTQQTPAPQTSFGATSTTVAYTSIAWWYSTPFLALIALSIILAILSLIFFTGAEGHRRWMHFKNWLRINKEGILVGLLVANVLLFLEFYPVFTIPFVGITLELFRQSYPIWVVWFTITALGMLAGAAIDAFWKPRQ